MEKLARKPNEKMKPDWRGALEDMKDQHTSVELQQAAAQNPGVANPFFA